MKADMYQVGPKLLPLVSLMIIFFNRLLASPALLASKGANMGTLYQIRPEIGTGLCPMKP